MNKSIVAAAALVAGVAIAAPMLARSADNPPQSGPAPEQSAPIIPPMGEGMMGQGMMGQGSGRQMMGGMPWHQGMGAFGERGPWREMMGGRMMRASPEERCEERLARRAAMIAYTVTKLNLTAEQRPLWDKLNAIIQNSTEKEQQLCAALKAGPQGGQPTILDRVDRMQRFLSTRLEALQQARPALEQLYQKLTPEQKAIIDHPHRMGG